MLTHNERAVEVRIEQPTRKGEAGGAVHAKNASFAPEFTLHHQLLRRADVRGRLGQLPVRWSSGPRKHDLPKVTDSARTKELGF